MRDHAYDMTFGVVIHIKNKITGRVAQLINSNNTRTYILEIIEISRREYKIYKD